MWKITAKIYHRSWIHMADLHQGQCLPSQQKAQKHMMVSIHTEFKL